MVCAKYEVMIAAMAESCMTPKEIAEAAGVSVNVVYRVRKGYMVKMEMLGRICRVLGLKCEDTIDFVRTEKYKKERSKR